MNQQTALEILKMGHNVFLTGAAGSGKTFLLNQYIEHLKKNKIKVAVTASTGIAATHMNGVTIHSWSGMGIKESLDQKDLKKMARQYFFQTKFRKTNVLIIDEISMLHAHQLEMVDQICRHFRDPFQPFGGLQVIFCGDFFQLPPVNKTPDQPTKLANESRVWENSDLKICYLQEQHRQECPDISHILNSIRTNKTNQKTTKLLSSRHNQPVKTTLQLNSGPDEKITRLFTHNQDVDYLNNQELARIKNPAITYVMQEQGNEKLTFFMKKSCLAPERLTLKKDALVMFVKNNPDKGYVNGTLGQVVDFEEAYKLPIVRTFNGEDIEVHPENWLFEEEGEVKAQISQIPLRLAWAITVHKSQGMTLDAAEIDLSKCFEFGMGYVALSRVKRLAGIKLLGFNDTALKVNPQIIELDKELQKHSNKTFTQIKKIPLKKKREIQDKFLKKIKPKKRKSFDLPF